MNRPKLIIVALAASCAVSASAIYPLHAETDSATFTQVASSPDVLVEAVVADVFAAIKAKKADPAALERIAETLIAPHCDFERMTSFAVGKAWRTATPKEREDLVREFRALLLRLYSGTLNAHVDYTYRIIGRPAASSATDATVKVEFRKASGSTSSPTVINAYLEKGTDSRWRIVDISVDGVSLLLSYRSGFQQEIKNGGISGLIEQLRKKNSK